MAVGALGRPGTRVLHIYNYIVSKFKHSFRATVHKYTALSRGGTRRLSLVVHRAQTPDGCQRPGGSGGRCWDDRGAPPPRPERAWAVARVPRRAPRPRRRIPARCVSIWHIFVTNGSITKCACRKRRLGPP